MKLFAYLQISTVVAWPSSVYHHNSFNRTYPEATYSEDFTQSNKDIGIQENALVQLWKESDTFSRPGPGLNPCSDTSMNKEEPWLTVCNKVHEACEPGNPEKWNTWYEQKFNLPGLATYGNVKKSTKACKDPATAVGCHDIDYAYARASGTLLQDHVTNRWYFRKHSKSPAISKTGVAGQNLELLQTSDSRKYYFGCFTRHQAAHILLFGGRMKERKQVHFTSYRSERGPGEQNNIVTGQKMIPLATGLIERGTERKFWLTTQDGPLDCTASKGTYKTPNVANANFLRTGGTDLWNPHFWEDYQDVIDNHLPFHSANHPRKIFFNATEREIQTGDEFSAHRYKVLTEVLNRRNNPAHPVRFSIDNYFATSFHDMTSWDENLQLLSNPFRLLYESGGKIYTWLKYSNRVGPIMVADNPTDQGNTPMGNSTHYMADWAPWEKRLIIENSLASGNIGGPLLYQQEAQARVTWRTFTMNYTTEKVTTTKHCYSHVYVPEDTTYDQWTTPACSDPRGCMSIKMDINPCIWDLEWLDNNSGALVNSNISFPRPGTWDSSTREFTFSGGDVARYPFEKIKIEEPLKIFGESSYFSCSADGGWFKMSRSDPMAGPDQTVDIDNDAVDILADSDYQTFMISRMQQPLWGRLEVGMPHIGINPGRKRRSSWYMARNLNIYDKPSKRKYFQAFVDEIKNGAWFYLADWMSFWPQEDNYFFEDEFARLPGYETQNLRINKGHPEELQRKYDHSDLSRVVWPYKYSYGRYNDLNKVKDLDMSDIDTSPTSGAFPITMHWDRSRSQHSGAQLIELLYPNYFDTTGKTDYEIQWMNYGAFEYLFGTHHTASTRFVGHNSLFVGLSDILTLEDTWDLRYPLCTGSECPDGCEAGTTAELLLDCYMAIDMRKYTESGHERDAQSTQNMHSEISLRKDPDSCHYQIQILTDCESYIGVFADFEDAETKEKHAFIANNYDTSMMPLNDVVLLREDFDSQDTETSTTPPVSTDSPTTESTPQSGAPKLTVTQLIVPLLLSINLIFKM